MIRAIPSLSCIGALRAGLSIVRIVPLGAEFYSALMHVSGGSDEISFQFAKKPSESDIDAAATFGVSRAISLCCVTQTRPARV
jgi:hypothetical protein